MRPKSCCGGHCKFRPCWLVLVFTTMYEKSFMLRLGQMGPSALMVFGRSVCRHVGNLRKFITMKQDFMDIRCADLSNSRMEPETRDPWTRSSSWHVPIYQLWRALKEFSLRILSAGRFAGLAPTPSVAESVFVSQLLRTSREANDTDFIADHLRWSKALTAPVPPISSGWFHLSCCCFLCCFVKQIQPVRRDGLTLPPVQSLEAQLKEAQAKLARLKLKINSSFGFSCTFRKLQTWLISSWQYLQATGQSQSYAASSLRPAKAGKSFSWASPHDVEDDYAAYPLFGWKTSDNCQGIGASVRPHPLRGTSGPTMKKWLQQFPAETRVRQNVSRCSRA